MTDLKIFMDTPQNASEQELKSYLDEACGEDAPLRAKVEALFRADKAAAAGFMKHSAVELGFPGRGSHDHS